MSVSELLFLNEEIPEDLLRKFKERMKDFSSEWLPEKGHDPWWDGCFADLPSNLPKCHYEFTIPGYNDTEIGVNSKGDAEWFPELLRGLSVEKDFVKAIIKETQEYPLYVRLHINHVITEEDLENVIEFNLDDYDFREGYAPKELRFEINKFYRLKVK